MPVPDDTPPLLRRSEVARMFRVHPSTVTGWARAGKLTAVWTPGGHRRFLESEVHAALAAEAAQPEA